MRRSITSARYSRLSFSVLEKMIDPKSGPPGEFSTHCISLCSLAGPDVPGEGTSGHYCQHSALQWNTISMTSRCNVMRMRSGDSCATINHKVQATTDPWLGLTSTEQTAHHLQHHKLERAWGTG